MVVEYAAKSDPTTAEANKFHLTAMTGGTHIIMMALLVQLCCVSITRLTTIAKWKWKIIY
jgi:hypothetical protein